MAGEDQPVKFSRSDASRWNSVETFAVPNKGRPWYQPPIVLLSTSLFLIYFFVLREENDMDEHLGLSLYDKVPGLEVKQLELRIKYDEEQGNDTTALKARLKAISEEKT